MSYFDMVANPVGVSVQEKLSLERLKTSVVKLRKNKDDGKYCSNGIEWKRSVNDVLTTNDLDMFLMKHCNIPAPAVQARELQWKKQANFHSSSQLSRIQALVREQKMKKEIVKKEPVGGEEERYQGVSIPPETPSKGEKKKEDVIDLTLGDSLEQAKLVFAQNAKWLAEAQREQQEKQLSEGDALPVLFVDPMTRCQKGQLASAEIEVEGWWYELESNEKRRKRMLVWDLLVHTIGAVDKEIWRLITVGDVYSLFNTVQNHLQTDQRDGIVHDLSEKMRALSIADGELFATFATRFRNLLKQSENVSLTFDGAVLRQTLTNAIESSANKVLKEHLHILQLEMDKAGVAYTALEMLNRLEPPMNRSEHRNARAKQKGSASGEADSERQKMSRKERKKKKKEKEAAAAAAAAAEDTSLGGGATALKANAGASQPVLGVCLFFQDGKCEKGESCRYEHRKLSAADKKALKEKMEKKKGTVKCHKCGEKGHYASTCKEKTVLSFSSSSSSSSSSNSQTSARQALLDLLKSGVDAEELALLAIELRGENSPVKPHSGATPSAHAGGEGD